MTALPNGAPFRSRRTLVAAVTLVVLAGLVWRWADIVMDAAGVDGASGSTAIRLLHALPVILLVAGLTVLGIRLTYRLIEHRTGSAPPRLTRQVIAVAAWAVNGAILAAGIFEVPLGSLVTTSGMMVAVLGIALKNMISDLFTGLSLPLKMGDWIEADGIVGRVVEVGWRATRMVTSDQVAVIIPNTHLTAKPFRNFSQPDPSFRDSFRVTLPATVTAYQAERNLTAAARQADLTGGLATLPEIRIAGFNDRGVEWELRYFVPDAGQASAVRFRIQRNLLRNLHFSGISLPGKQIQMHPPSPAPAQGVSEEALFLGGIDMFDTLTPDELSSIAAHMARRLARAGTPVVRQGEVGDSLFILKEGLLGVGIASDGIETVVGQIAPGQFFGEMSLLTGAPRGATVMPLVDSMVYEISREILEPVMRNRPEIAELMSRVLVQRQTANAPGMNVRDQSDAGREPLVRQLLGRISAFFRLRVEPATS